MRVRFKSFDQDSETVERRHRVSETLIEQLETEGLVSTSSGSMGVTTPSDVPAGGAMDAGVRRQEKSAGKACRACWQVRTEEYKVQLSKEIANSA